MPESQYLSIGEVLGLLLEDFPDVTISKIRFLESQGLIEPERTPSGYRKFYDHDVDLLRAILHEQRENFLPLKVIRDRIESGAIEGDTASGRTPPRGIRNVQMHPADAGTPGPTGAAHPERAASSPEQRDSVFRRTDGGPEWADGRALIPGATNVAGDRPPNPPTDPTAPGGRGAPHSPITAANPVTPLTPAPPPSPAPIVRTPGAPAPTDVARGGRTPEIRTERVLVAPTVIEPAEPTAPPTSTASTAPTPPVPRAAPSAGPPGARPAATARTALPYNREEFCAAAHLTLEQLDELESFGLISAKGTGRDASYPPEALEIATVAGRFLANGIDARHLRAWRQSADREAALFEQRIMPLLRQRNPASRQLALDTLAELAELGGRLRGALIDAALRQHYDAT